MGFCTETQYHEFMRTVPVFEASWPMPVSPW